MLRRLRLDLYTIHPVDIKEIREWIQLAFLIAGGTLAIIAFFQNLRQRRFENALKLVSLFRDALRPNDLNHWKDLFVHSCDLASVPKGFFAGSEGRHIPLGTMWSEGSEDDDAIQRISENIEIICYEICHRTVDPRFVYYELGQLMTETHRWLSEITETSDDKKFIGLHYPWTKRAFEKYGGKFQKWPRRTYAYIE